MKHTGLDRPRSKSVDFEALPHSNRQILMPGHFPVCIGDFVEENAADWIEPLAEYRPDQLLKGFGSCESSNLFRDVEEIANCKNAVTFPHRLSLVHPLERRDQLTNPAFRNNGVENGEPVSFDLLRNSSGGKHA